MRKLYTVIILIIISSFMNAQTLSWDKMKGPEGGMANELFNMGDTICTINYSTLYFSTDNGEHWDAKDIKYNFPRLYKCADGSYIGKIFEYGLYKSTDLENWDLVFPWPIKAIERDPFGTFFMITNKDVYTSKDNGVTWTLTYTIPGAYPVGIAFNKKYIYLLESSSIIRKGYDSADTWTFLSFPNQVYNINDIAADTNGNIFVSSKMAKIAYSTNNGDSWAWKNLSSFTSGCYGIACSNNFLILSSYLNTNWGNYKNQLFVSYDKTATWEQIIDGIPDLSFKTSPVYFNNSFFINVSGTGPFRLVRTTWQPAYNGINEHNFLSITKDNRNKLWSAINGKGIFTSTDHGSTWSRYFIDSVLNKNPYVIKRTSDGVLFAGSKSTLFRSSDNGTSWQQIITQEPLNGYGLYMDKFNRMFLIIGYKFYLSTDKGNTWSIYFISQEGVRGIASPSLTNTVVGTNNTYTTTNNGVSWFRNYFTNYSNGAPACDDSGNVFVSIELIGFMKSTDYGVTWRNVSRDNTRFGSGFAYDKKGNYFNYEGWLNILLYSSDKGESWRDGFGNMPKVKVQDMFADDDYVFAATDGGLFRLNSIATSVNQESFSLPEKYQLFQNYPNPFNPSTQITFSLPTDEHVKISAYDILGKEISLLINDYQKAGIHNITFNAKGLPSGIYFCRLITKNYSHTIKMILIR